MRMTRLTSMFANLFGADGGVRRIYKDSSYSGAKSSLYCLVPFSEGAEGRPGMQARTSERVPCPFDVTTSPQRDLGS